MTYSTIQPPFTLKFREMPKKDLLAYAAWFHDMTPTRIAELAKAVKGTSGYESWEPNATPESLENLGAWFGGQVERRKRTAEEMATIRAKLTSPIDIADEELTNRTFSLAMDLGMYFAQVVLKNVPGTRWEQELRNKKSAEYGQPSVMGASRIPLNPVRILVNVAYGSSHRGTGSLRQLYNTWARTLPTPPSRG